MDFLQDPSAPDHRVGRILDMVATETGIDRALIRPEARADEIGISSLDMTQAIFQLETEFNIGIP